MKQGNKDHMIRFHRFILSAACLWGLLLILVAAPAQAESFRIIGLGDSLMAGYRLPSEEAFPARLETALRARGHDVRVVNAGVSGDTTSGGLARLDWALADGADLVLLQLGANDAFRGVQPQQTRQNLARMIEKIRAAEIQILLVGLKAPRNLGARYQKDFDRIYPDLARQYNLPLLPFFLEGVALKPELNLADGIHPNLQGVEVMVQNILPVIEPLLP